MLVVLQKQPCSSHCILIRHPWMQRFYWHMHRLVCFSICSWLAGLWLIVLPRNWDDFLNFFLQGHPRFRRLLEMAARFSQVLGCSTHACVFPHDMLHSKKFQRRCMQSHSGLQPKMILAPGTDQRGGVGLIVRVRDETQTCSGSLLCYVWHK